MGSSDDNLNFKFLRLINCKLVDRSDGWLRDVFLLDGWRDGFVEP